MPLSLPVFFPIHLFVVVRFLLAPWLGRVEVRALRSAQQSSGVASSGTGAKLRYYKRFCLGNLIGGSSCWALWSLMPVAAVQGGSLFHMTLSDLARACVIGGGIGGLIGEGIELLLLRRKNSKGAARRRKIFGARMYMLPATKEERRWFFAVGCMAGYGEELCYRMFLIGYLMVFLSLHAAAALLISSVIFGFAHLSQGHRLAITTTLVGLFLGVVYLGTGQIWYAMLLHALFNLRLLPELRLLGLIEVPPSDTVRTPEPPATPASA